MYLIAYSKENLGRICSHMLPTLRTISIDWSTFSPFYLCPDDEDFSDDEDYKAFEGVQYHLISRA